LKRHPVLAQIKEHLVRCGAIGALMSGSGPTVFGIFTGQKEAEKSAAEFKRAGNWSVFAVQSL
jgi:4-diphosphocytidyl-2-C-methyl-D-erythritol kinase